MSWAQIAAMTFRRRGWLETPRYPNLTIGLLFALFAGRLDPFALDYERASGDLAVYRAK